MNLRNVIALCKLQIFLHICLWRESSPEARCRSYLHVSHTVSLKKLLFSPHSFPFREARFQQVWAPVAPQSCGFMQPYPLRWPSRIFAVIHWCTSSLILLVLQTETLGNLNTMGSYRIIQKKIDFAGSSSATHFICAIIFHCPGLTHEIKAGKWWFMSDNNLLCNIFVLLREGNNYSASLLSDAKNLAGYRQGVF